LKRPDISILSEHFREEVLGLKHKHVAAELLSKLLMDEVKTRATRFIISAVLHEDP
jgi:type I restriction enzyme R subunit